MEPLALTAFVAIAIVALLLPPGVFCPAEVAVAGARKAEPLAIPGDDEDELPQTDRSPSTRWLPWAVGAVAAARLVVLVALHA